MSSNFVAGIDPGKSGGWAIHDIERRRMVAGGPLAFDECDRKLFHALQKWGVQDVLLERAQAAPGDANAFEYGRGFGRTEAAVALAGCNRLYVGPAWWKGKIGCPVDKKGAVALAERYFPDLPFFANNGPRGGKDSGTAEAALIGLFLVRPSLRVQVERNNSARLKGARRQKVRFEL